MPVFDTLALRKREFWSAVGGEFIATTIFVFMVCASTLNWENTSCALLRISLTAGMTIASLALTIGHLSGGLMNPAVNIAFLVSRRITLIEGAFFTVAQFCGGKFTFQRFRVREESVIVGNHSISFVQQSLLTININGRSYKGFFFPRQEVISFPQRWS